MGRVTTSSQLPTTFDREAGARLREHVVAQIRSGTWRPGHRLPGERALATESGVSRPVVREVVRTLAAQGLLVVSPARGVFVRPPSTGDAAAAVGRLIAVRGATVRDVARARQVLEAEAAERAADAGGGPVLRRLERLGGEVDDGTDLLTQARTDLDYHLSLSLAVGNPVLLAMHRSIAAQVLGMMLRRQQHPDPSTDPCVVLHREITAAVASHDADRARALMLRHLDSTESSFGDDFDRPVEDVAREDLRRIIGTTLTFDQLTTEVLAELDKTLDGPMEDLQ